jgi:ABC-type Zn uptake system ZnuABC Zn-binding protein ZnuA
MKISRIDKVTLLAIAKGITAVWLSLASLGLTACAGGANPSSARDEKLLVAASIAPLADFARQVGGDHVGVITLVPPGASPHTFEPTPSQVAQMARARVLALNGVGLEYWAGRLIEGVDNPKLSRSWKGMGTGQAATLTSGSIRRTPSCRSATFEMR